MPKNLGVIDVKPSNQAILDITSKNSGVIDTIPKMKILSGELTQSYSVVINAGQWTGFLLAMTYPTQITVTQWSEKG